MAETHLNRLKNISFITAHFHDFRWTERLLRQLAATMPAEAITEILVIDQDRTDSSRARLAALHPKVRVVQYPRDERFFRALGHDHPAVLNQAVQAAQGDWICVFDSDAHPIRAGWLAACEAVLRDHDAILAEDPQRPGLSHPCFMLFPRQSVQLPLRFDEGLLEERAQFAGGPLRTDTGREIARQLTQAGQGVHVAAAAWAFDGQWGSLYLDCVYHHGSGSFKGGDKTLTRQLTWEHRLFEAWVLERGEYRLRGAARGVYQVRSAAWDLRNKLVKGFRLLRSPAHSRAA
jgi:hypothetical protein